MAHHELGPGIAVIDGLAELAAPLGYTALREWRIPGKAASVDVVWLRRPADDAPLVAFEVESRAGTGLASNVLKMLSRPGALQPLHFFHLVVEGGRGSARPEEVVAAFGSHNYSVHLLSESGEPRRFLQRVIDVHARVEDRLDGIALARALARGPWPENDIDPLLQHAEARKLYGLSERAYVLLALGSDKFRPSLRRKLLELWHAELAGEAEPPNRYYEPPQRREEPYGSYMAAAACEPIELGLIATLDPASRARAFDLLMRWQEFNHIGDRLGEYTGSGSQWTEYIVDNIGYYWALVAALMREVPGARAWCAAQPNSLLSAIDHSADQPVGLLAAWVMHIAAGVDGAEAIYEHARRYIAAQGGIDREWLVEPEPTAPSNEDGRLIVGHGVAPAADELLLLTRAARPVLGVVDLALRALVEDPVLRPRDGADLALQLATDPALPRS